MKPVGDGTRILNFLVDTAIIFVLAFFVKKAYDWYVMYWGYKHFNFNWFFFGTLFVYYFIFESIFLRTPGKWVSFSQVVNREGKRPGIHWILIRSAVRLIIIDLFFLPFLGKTLHDYLSKTVVVSKGDE